MSERASYGCGVSILRPGDRVGWIDAGGVLHIDIVRDRGDMDWYRRQAARLESIRRVVSELLGESES